MTGKVGRKSHPLASIFLIAPTEIPFHPRFWMQVPLDAKLQQRFISFKYQSFPGTFILSFGLKIRK